MTTDTQIHNDMNDMMEEFRIMTPGADALQKSGSLENIDSNSPSRTAETTAPQTQGASQTGSAAPQAPSHNDIARRAFDIYVKKGRQQGQCRQDWQQAEQDMTKETRASHI